MDRIYLDHAATTPLSKAAEAAMRPWLNAGNPSSLYAEGRKAKDALDSAREILSDTLGCRFAEVLFTSGGTEAANLAIVGTALQNEDSTRNRVLLGAAEHHCVLHTQSLLERLGYRVELIPVDREARVDPNTLPLGPDVLLVSVMHANNELGSVNPVRAIADRVHEYGAIFHTDAVQSFLKPELGSPTWKVADLDADLVTISAHKVNGPKGTGAIYMRAGVKLKSLIGGGGQEREVRGGTENVAGIVGFGKAVAEHVRTPHAVSQSTRESLATGLADLGALASVRQGPTLRGHVHGRFPGIPAQTLLIALDRAGVAASSGAACSSGSVEPSHVLLACGYSPIEAAEGVRFTLGPETRPDEVEEALLRLARVLDRIRG